MDSSPVSQNEMLPKKRKRGSRKRQRCGDDTEQDRISNLPDDILVSILEQLDAKSAVATSLLSRQWRHLWKSSSNFDFDLWSILSDRQASRIRSSGLEAKLSLCPWKRRVPLSSEHIELRFQRHATRAVLRSAGSLLGLSHGPRVKSLRLRLRMKDEDIEVINELIDNAIDRGVEVLDIRPAPMKYSMYRAKGYKFPYWLFSNGRGDSLTRLMLFQCALSIPSDFTGFSSITELHFADMPISGRTVHILLQKCRHLRSLFLSHCFRITYLRIASPDLKLQDLVVTSPIQIQGIEILAPRLKRLQYQGRFIPLPLKSVPSLEHVSLEFDTSADAINYMLENLSTDLPSLKNLTLIFQSPERCVTPKALPMFYGNLKNLALHVFVSSTDDLLWMTFLLEAAPFLETFQTNVVTNKEKRSCTGISWKPGDFQHHHLKKVSMHRFRARHGEIALARFLLAKAPRLESIIFDRAYIMKMTGWSWDHFESSKKCWTKEERSAISKRLKEGICSSAHLVFT